MSVTRMRSAGFALERSAIIVTGSTMTTLPPCSICTLAWPSAVMVMAPPGASTVVVVGSWAYPTPAANTTNEATLHRSFMKVLLSPFRRAAAGLYSAAATARSIYRRRITYDSRSEANVCGRHSGEPGVPGHDGESAGTDGCRAGADGGRDLQDRPIAARHPGGHVLRGDGDLRQLDGQ